MEGGLGPPAEAGGMDWSAEADRGMNRGAKARRMFSAAMVLLEYCDAAAVAIEPRRVPKVLPAWRSALWHDNCC